MYEYVIKNPETVMKNVNISMRNSNMRDSRVKKYLHGEMKRLYSDKIDFEYGCNSDHWMEVSFDIVIATLVFGVPFGYYNLSLGWSCCITIDSNNELNVITVDKIIPPTEGCQMIVYNGTNHFKYLRSRPSNKISPAVTKECLSRQDDVESNTRGSVTKNVRDIDSIRISLASDTSHAVSKECVFTQDEVESNTRGSVSKKLSDLDSIVPFEPDYLACKMFLSAIGYDIIKPDLIGYHLLSVRALKHMKSKSWLNKHKMLYNSEWKECIQMQEKRHPRKRIHRKKSTPTVKQEPNKNHIKESKTSSNINNTRPKKKSSAKVKLESNINMSIKLKSSSDTNIVPKQKHYPRATKSCCFVGCYNKNLVKGIKTLFKFHRLPPIPKTIPNDLVSIEKHYTYYKRLHYRMEYLDRCGFQRNDKRKDLRICSSHEYEDLCKSFSFHYKRKKLMKE